jgi:peptidoglycan hydrolase-like protein with peptidoglycan-binding domain
MDLQTIARSQTSYPISTARNDRQLVQSIQASLNVMGFPAGTVDGIWDQETDNAYKAFSREYGFRPDEVSPRAARFIISSVGVIAVPTPSPAPTPRPVPVPVPIPRPTPTPQPQTDVLGEALRFTLKWEGGYVNDPYDPGGETNKGVTIATYNSYRSRKGLSRQSVRYITDAEVYEIYRDMYWAPSQSNLMTRALAIVHFDTAVNFGVGGATIFLQETLGLRADGVFGNMTRDALSRANSAATARKYVQGRINYRYQRVRENPTQERFLQGWLNRDNDLSRYIANMT